MAVVAKLRFSYHIDSAFADTFASDIDDAFEHMSNRTRSRKVSNWTRQNSAASSPALKDSTMLVYGQPIPSTLSACPAIICKFTNDIVVRLTSA